MNPFFHRWSLTLFFFLVTYGLAVFFPYFFGFDRIQELLTEGGTVYGPEEIRKTFFKSPLSEGWSAFYLPPPVTLGKGLPFLPQLFEALLKTLGVALSSTLLALGMAWGWIRSPKLLSLFQWIGTLPALVFGPLLLLLIYAVKPGLLFWSWVNVVVYLALPLSVKLAFFIQNLIRSPELQVLYAATLSRGYSPLQAQYHAQLRVIFPRLASWLGGQTASLISGSAFGELLFHYPAFGTFFWRAYMTRELPVLQWSFFVLMTLILLIRTPTVRG